MQIFQANFVSEILKFFEFLRGLQALLVINSGNFIMFTSMLVLNADNITVNFQLEL